jgi:hypothetical protein
VSLLPLVLKHEDLRRILAQYFLVFVIGILLHVQTKWRERGRILRNEFEHQAYDMIKPYKCPVSNEAITKWQRSYCKSPTNKCTKHWFKKVADSTPSPTLGHQIRSAQLESLRFGKATRNLWAAIIVATCVAIAVIYAWASQGHLFSSPEAVLGAAAVLAAIGQIGKIATVSFSHARDRQRRISELEQFALVTPEEYIKAAPVFQERINACRSSRVIVPRFVYVIIEWLDRKTSVDAPCECDERDELKAGVA